MNNEMAIDGEKIEPGTTRFMELDIARLTSGTEIKMPVHVFRTAKPGPKVLLSGGMHGDEVNGIELLRKFLKQGWLKKLQCGSVIVVPIINVYGFINFSREVPDGKDVNRSFPGNKEGSLASAVAYTMTNCILPEVDFGLDFHTGGASRTNYPQLRYEEDDAIGAEVSDAFKAPFTLHSNVIAGSFREAARAMDKTVVVFEGGESLRLDPRTIEEGIAGIRRVLHHYEMLPRAPLQKHRTHFFNNSHWLRAETSGLFRFEKDSGRKVRVGETLGYISAPTNEYSKRVTSPYDGYIIGHNNFPLVHQGDALFHIGTRE